MLAINGVGASPVLVLVLDGIFAGAMRQVSAYIRSSPADVFVAQEDVRTMHMTQSALRPPPWTRCARSTVSPRPKGSATRPASSSPPTGGS